MAQYTYEEAVRLLRQDTTQQQRILESYFDEDTLAAATRFAASEEFAALCDYVGVSRLKGSGRPKQILDLSCGNGIASFAFANLGHQVTAADPDESEEVGLGAVRKLIPHLKAGSIETARAFAEQLPFTDNTFDIVYVRQALHHFMDLKQGLSECRRVLKPGGVFFSAREHVVDDEAQLAQFLREHPLHRWHGGENAYPVAVYQDALEAAGLVVRASLGPADTVINHYPVSNAEFKRSLREALTRKYGNLLAQILIQLPPMVQRSRRRRSQSNHHPGRLHSFLAYRPS